MSTPDDGESFSISFMTDDPKFIGIGELFSLKVKSRSCHIDFKIGK